MQLTQGLVEQAESKVHVNGRFTDSIKLEHDVRQGCPMSTLLFVISTHPFVEMIKEKVSLGELKGIDQDGGRETTIASTLC